MKIAYLTQSYPPMVSGASLVAERLAKEMIARRHKVLVIAASEQEHSYLTVDSNLTVLRLRSYHNPQRVGQRFLLYPRRAILRSLSKFRPDIIHCHDPLQTGILGIEYAHRANIPAILSIHQLPWFVSAYLPNIYGIHNATEAVLWMYARWILRQFTALITPTNTIANIIRSKIGVESQIISYGIDSRTFRPPHSTDDETSIRARLNLPLDVPIILHVGRLDADKGVERIILAAERSLHDTDAHLLIVGDGRQKPALMQLCKSKRITHRCHFTGFVSIKQGLPEIYRLANLFVTASEIETQGIVLLEAATSGLPIVAVRATCIPEIVHDGVNGYLAEPGDIDAIGQAITTLLTQPQKATNMGKASIVLANRHTIQTTLDKHEQLYFNLVAQREIQFQKVRTQEYWERAKEWLNL